MVSGRTLMISQSTRMPRLRLDALLQHEVSILLLTHVMHYVLAQELSYFKFR